MLGIRFAQDWLDWHQIGFELTPLSLGLAPDWYRIGTGTAMSGWLRIGDGLAIDWRWIGDGLAMDWQLIGRLATDF